MASPTQARKPKKGKQVWIPASDPQFRAMQRAADKRFQRLGAWMLDQCLGTLRQPARDTSANGEAA
jgi:hypothetical protein